MKLSILDFSLVPSNGDRHQALMNTLDIAKHADDWGFHRFWLAEHHAAGTAAGRTPEVMIPFIAAQTKRIRVGSGGMLLNHYSPFKVAEVFNTLEELYPGRIDMGIGRARTGMVADMAMQAKRSESDLNTKDPESQLVELLHWMRNDFDAKHPYSEIKSYNNGSTSEFWLLGSSAWSANAAAQQGVAYAFSGFLNPEEAYAQVQNYKQNFKVFKPGVGLQHPNFMLALNVFVAPTLVEANRMSAPFQLFERRLRTSGDTQSLFENEDDAIRLMSGLPSPQPLKDPKSPPKTLIGTPEMIFDWLHKIAEAFGTDEIMIHNLSSHHEARLRSHQLLSEIFELNKHQL